VRPGLNFEKLHVVAVKRRARENSFGNLHCRGFLLSNGKQNNVKHERVRVHVEHPIVQQHERNELRP
jgi:hypothetical protein